MKKQKRERNPAAKPEVVQAAKPGLVWWPWALAALGLFLAFEAYGPSMNGAFVLDDLSLPFMNPKAAQQTFAAWIGGMRPLLMASYYINYQQSGTDPYIYHLTNVFLHFLGSIVTALVTARLLDRAGIPARSRTVLSVFAGGLFLLHPLQTESVAYVASRSEVLSVLLYFSAFAVFLYRRDDEPAWMNWVRAIAIVVLFGAAVSTKEHTLTLPVLLVFADFFWGLGGIRKNGVLYGLLAAAMVLGGLAVARVLRGADTAGFGLQGLSPAAYFFTQCRVVWMYVRLFFVPFGQNADPDIAISQGLDFGAIAGLLAMAAAVVAAWIYRKKYPLAAFGLVMFLLLLAPTSSFVPIRDVLAERRLYLPFLGLTLILIEFLRRLPAGQVAWTCAAILCLCLVLTYQRSNVWSSPIALWQDTVEKSPNKWRPQFQLAHAYYAAGLCPQAADQYAKTATIKADDVSLLVDWGLALDCAGRPDDALTELDRAAALKPTAHVYSQIGMVYGKQHKFPEALAALEKAEAANPRFEMTYVYRGTVYELKGDREAARREYQRALDIAPNNQAAHDAMARVRQ